MKRRIFLLLLTTTLASNAFAQGPPDPNPDPEPGIVTHHAIVFGAYEFKNSYGQVLFTHYEPYVGSGDTKAAALAQMLNQSINGGGTPHQYGKLQLEEWGYTVAPDNWHQCVGTGPPGPGTPFHWGSWLKGGPKPFDEAVYWMESSGG